MNQHRRVEYAAILFLTAIWGSAFAFIKIAVDTFTPGQLTLARFIPTLPIFLWIAYRYRSQLRLLRKSDWIKLGAAGICATSIYNLGLNTGETHVGAGLASLVISLNPAFILLGALIVRGERVKSRFMVGMIVSFIGVFILTLVRNGLGFDKTALSGIVFILLCPLSWAAYTTLIHGVVERTGVMAATAAASVIGTITMLPALPFAFRDGIPTDQNAWLCVGFLGLFSTVIGFTIWSWLLQRRGAARTGMVVYLNVVWGLLFAGLILGERITWQTGSGALLILTGVAIARRSGRSL